MQITEEDLKEHWNKLLFSEALREVYAHYGWVEVKEDVNVRKITLGRKHREE